MIRNLFSNDARTPKISGDANKNIIFLHFCSQRFLALGSDNVLNVRYINCAISDVLNGEKVPAVI